MEVLRLPAFHPAIPQDDRAFDEDISGLPAISARVHADCAADRSGNAPQKFHAGNARVPRSARYADAHGGGACTDAVSRLDGDLRHGFWQAHHHAGHAAVTDDKIRADTRSEEHTSELQSLMSNSYAVFCLKKKT